MANGIKEAAIGRSDLYRLDPTLINIKEDWNGRNDSDPDNIAHIEALSLSIKEVGVKQALTVYQEDGKFYVSDGHCRLKAVRLAMSQGAEIKSVPVQMEDRYSNEADRVFSQIVRNSGKPLSPFEQGRVFKRLIGYGWSVADIASKSGVNQQWVKELLELQTSSPTIQKLVGEGQVSASLAISTMKTHGTEAGEALATAVETAKAAGKTRATKQHLPGTKPVGKMERLRELMGAKGRFGELNGDRYVSTFTADEYAEIRSIVGF